MAEKERLEKALGGEPTEERMTALIADVIVYCRARGIRAERLFIDAVLLAAN